MKAKAISTVDRVFRGVSRTICMILLDADIVLLMVPLLKVSLIHAGMSLGRAEEISLYAIFGMAPLVLLGNAALILVLRRRLAKSQTAEGSPNLNNAHHANGIVAIG